MVNVDFHERSRKLQRKENRSDLYLTEYDRDLVGIDGWPSWALNAAFRRADLRGPRGWSPGGVVAVHVTLGSSSCVWLGTWVHQYETIFSHPGLSHPNLSPAGLGSVGSCCSCAWWLHAVEGPILDCGGSSSVESRVFARSPISNRHHGLVQVPWPLSDSSSSHRGGRQHDESAWWLDQG